MQGPLAEELGKPERELIMATPHTIYEEGELQGRRVILLRQLRKRFGELSAAIRSRLMDAEADALDRWAERFVDAKSLADIFGEPELPVAK